MAMSLMGVQSELVVCAAIGSIYKELVEKGYRIEQSHDFSEFKKICNSREGRPLSAQADDRYFDFCDGNGYFLVAYDSNDQVVGTTAALVDNLRRSNLAQLWESRLPRLYGGRLGCVRAPGAFDISGLAIYHGDLWVAPGQPVRGLGYLLPRLSLLLSLSEYRPDFCYALFAPRMARGFNVDMGFSFTQPKAIEWDEAPNDFNEDFWLSYATLDDLHHLAYTIFAEIHQSVEA